MLQGVFGDLTQGDLPILRELLDGEFKTRAQQEIYRLEMEATLNPLIAYKLKMGINNEMGRGVVKSNYFMTDKNFEKLNNEEKKDLKKYNEEQKKMVMLVKAELNSSKPIKGISIGGSLKKQKKNNKY